MPLEYAIWSLAGTLGLAGLMLGWFVHPAYPVCRNQLAAIVIHRAMPG